MNANSTSPLRRPIVLNDRSFSSGAMELTVSGRVTGTVLAAIAWSSVGALILLGWARLTEALGDPLISTMLLALPILVLASLLGGRRS